LVALIVDQEKLDLEPLLASTFLLLILETSS